MNVTQQHKTEALKLVGYASISEIAALLAECESLRVKCRVIQKETDNPRAAAERIYNRLASLPETGWVHGNTFLPANVLCDHNGQQKFIELLEEQIKARRCRCGVILTGPAEICGECGLRETAG